MLTRLETCCVRATRLVPTSLTARSRRCHLRSFSASIDLPGGALSTMSVAVGDVNADGWLDLIFTDYNVANQLLLGEGNGTYSTWQDLPGWSLTTNQGPLTTLAVAVADVNFDGWLDLIFANYRDANQLLLGTGNHTHPYTEWVNLPGGSHHAYSVAVADVDADGDLPAQCNSPSSAYLPLACAPKDASLMKLLCILR